ncbi:MAG: phage tail tape measure protein [Candidatus Kapabacteria bacterium]|nr:phage tail tape measure protein [Candidatus Kapabacteria bacterium]
MASKNVEFILDLLVKYKADSASAERVVANLEQKLKDLHPEIDFDSDTLKAGLRDAIGLLDQFGDSVDEAFDGFDEFDTDGVEKGLNELEQLFDEMINSLDDEAINKMLEAFEGFDDLSVEGIVKEFQKVGGTVGDTDKILKNFVKSGKDSLEQMKGTGKEGTDTYKKLEKEIAKAEKQLKTLKDTNKSIDFGNKVFQFNQLTDTVHKITSAFGQFITPYKDFDKQLRNIGTLGVQNFEEFRTKAIDLASGVPDTVAGVTEGIYNAISAGAIQVTDGIADVAGGMVFVEQASKLAVAGLTDTNAAIKGLAAVTNAYGTDVLSAGKAADVLFGTVKNGVTTVPELNASLSQVVPIAAAAGFSFEQVGAAIATLTKQGVPTAQAATQIRGAIAELLKPGAQLKQVMTEAGVSLETLERDGLQETMRKIGIAMDSMGTDAANTFSSIESIQFALAATGKNALKASLDLASIKDSAGSVEEAYAIASEGIGVKAQGILNQVEAFAFKIFGKLGDSSVVFLDTVNSLAPTVTTFAGLANVIPVDKIASQVKSVSTQFGSLIKNADGFGGALKGISGKLAQSGGIIGKIGPMAFNPWVLGSAAAIGAVTLFLTKTDKGQQLLAKGTLLLQNLMQKLAPIFEGLLDIGESYIDVLLKWGEILFEYFITPYEVAYELIVSFIDTILELTGSSLEGASSAESMGLAFQHMGQVIGTVADSLNGILMYIKNVKEYVIGFARGMPEILGALFEIAVYYMNPVNWISGDEEFEQKLKDKLNNAIGKAFEDVGSRIKQNNLDNALEQALEIKGDLDKNKEVEKLITKYENAKDDIERNNIARAIAETVPQAVKGFKTIINEQGEVVRVMEISADKAKSFLEAQNQVFSDKLSEKQQEITEGIQSQSEAYSEAIVKQKELAKQIVEIGAKGGNDEIIKDLKKQYDEAGKEAAKFGNNIRENLEEAGKVGITLEGVEIPPEARLEFRDQLAELQKEANKADIGAKISDMVKLKGKIDDENQLQKFVEQFEQTTDELEKASIAEAIKKSYPDAVEQTGVLVDANGKLVDTYKVNVDAVKNYSSAQKSAYGKDLQDKQKQFIDGIADEGRVYIENGKKLETLRTQINEHIEQGKDTSDLRTQYELVSDEIEVVQDKMIEALAQSEKAGFDTGDTFKQVAKTLGLSEEEVRKMVKAQIESNKLTERARFKVGDLAKAWDEARGSADSMIKSQTSAIAEIDKMIKDERDPEERKKLQDDRSKLLTGLKDQVKEKKNLDALEERIKIESGQVERAGRNAYEYAKAIVDQKTKAISTEQRMFEINYETSRLEAEREKTAFDEFVLANKQLDGLREQKKVLEETYKITRDNEGAINVGLRVKPDEKKEIALAVADMDRTIQENLNKISELKLNIKLDKVALQREFDDFENQKLLFEIDAGIKSNDDFSIIIERYKARLELIKSSLVDQNEAINAIEQERDKKLAELGENASEEQRLAIENEYNARLNTAKRKGLDLEKQEFDLGNSITSTITTQYDRRLAKVRSYYDSESQLIDARYSEQEARLQRFTESYDKSQQERIAIDKSSTFANLDESKNEQLKQLDNLRDMELISKEDLEKRKLEIEDDYRKKKQQKEVEFQNLLIGMEQQKVGVQRELQRRKDEELLTAERNRLKDEIAIVQDKNKIDQSVMNGLLEANRKYQDARLIAEKAGTTDSLNESKRLFEEYSKIAKQSGLNESELQMLSPLINDLNNSEILLDQKTTDLAVLMELLGENITEAQSDLFAGGGTEAMVENARAFFGQLVGILQKKVEGFVLDLVLSPGVVSFINSIPFPGNIAALGLVQQTLSLFVKKLSEPFLQSIMSFASGGRFDVPTAIVGDASEKGGRNAEWVFRDVDLIAYISLMATNIVTPLIQEIRLLREAVENQKLITEFTARKMKIMLVNENAFDDSRTK